MGQEITAKLIQDLRSRTGISIGKCKEALVAAEGDIETAIDNLRKAGLASAVKKEGREAKEGQVVVGQSNDTVTAVEVNAETDFVAKNDKFQAFANSLAEEAAKTKPANVAAFLAQPAPHDKSITIDQYRSLTVQSLGENIQVRRLHNFAKAADTSFGIYSHMGGKIVVVVELSGASDQAALAKDIAMHAAAEAPEFVSPDQIPAEAIERERDIAKEQVKGKPENIIDKIVDGKLSSYYDQVCLLRQKFIKNPDLTIATLLEKHGKEAGKPLTIKQFIRWTVGEES